MSESQGKAGVTETFQPYVPNSISMTEFTLRAVIPGLLMTLILGAANAYLGLKAGQTIAATYPAAVISMVVMRIWRGSILEENLARSRLEFEARRDDVRAGPLRVDQVGVAGFHGRCSEDLGLTERGPAVKHAEDPQTLAARHAGRRGDRGHGNQGDSGKRRARPLEAFLDSWEHVPLAFLAQSA